MERKNAYRDATTLEKTMMIGSVLSGVALFALSVMMMMIIGFFLGALVITERIAQECSDDEESYTGELASKPVESYEEIERYEGIPAGVVIPHRAFSQAA